MDKATVLEIFRKVKPNNALDNKDIDGEGFNDAVKSTRILLG